MSTLRSPAEDSAKLLDVQGVADLLGCSARHVYRLSDAGKMPTPVRLGSLVRWSKAAITAWVADGCPTVRSVKGGRV
jgi:excisionase family DNA binding protein